MIRCAITDISREIAEPEARRLAVTEAARRWAAMGVGYVQLREKCLAAGELYALAEELMAELRTAGGRTRLLINGRADIAVAAGCDGVHLTAAPGEMTPAQVRVLFERSGRPRPVVSVSCHSVEGVNRASREGADFVLFGPVFEKVIGGAAVSEGRGLSELALAVQAAGSTPVLALGGITPSNMAACLALGATGVAGIRLFS